MKFTIFTPTYNRGYIIETLYHSLRNQTFRDFEWIVIDDGSTDNTEELFSMILKEKNDFTITYKKVANGGKHRAVNIGTQLAKGELFFIVDSDDSLPCDSLQKILTTEQTIDERDKASFAGVCGLRGAENGTALGLTFEGKTIDATYLETKKYNIFGDKAEVFYTDVIRKYPFPEFEGENFIPESTAWNLIGAAGLKFRYFNEVVYYCEYLPDGLTRMEDKTKKYPKAYGLLLQQNIKIGKIKKSKQSEAIYDYYCQLKDDFLMKEIAEYLGIHSNILFLRIMQFKLNKVFSPIKNIICKKFSYVKSMLKGK